MKWKARCYGPDDRFADVVVTTERRALTTASGWISGGRGRWAEVYQETAVLHTWRDGDHNAVWRLRQTVDVTDYGDT